MYGCYHLFEGFYELLHADLQGRQSVAQLTEKQAPGRLKQWLAMLTRNYPQAVELFTALRRETDLNQVSRLLGMPHPTAV